MVWRCLVETKQMREFKKLLSSAEENWLRVETVRMEWERCIVWQWEWRTGVCVCVCVCDRMEWERMCMCVCVCVKETEQWEWSENRLCVCVCKGGEWRWWSRENIDLKDIEILCWLTRLMIHDLSDFLVRKRCYWLKCVFLKKKH